MFRFSLLFLFIQTAGLFAQTTIFLDNPSFEDVPSIAHPPQRWYFCGQPGESPPDIHPGGFFGVERLARDGATFVGMVVRDNGTHEGIGQRLASPLQAGHCYSFSLYAARSETYQSVSRATGAPANFSQPAALYLWGGFKNCDQRELLAKSPAILYEGWKQYSFSLQPRDDYTHLSIEAYFAIPGAPYNGNVLIDFIQPLIPYDTLADRPEAEMVKMEDAKPDLGRESWETLIHRTLRSQGLRSVFEDPSGNAYHANPDWWIFFRTAVADEMAVQLNLSAGRSDLEQVIREAALEAGYPLNHLRLKKNRRKTRDPGFRWKSRQLLVIDL